MELRLHRLLTRREKTTNQSPQVNLQKSSSRSSIPQWPITAATPCASPDSSSVYTTLDNQDGILQAIPYDAVCPGKTPIFSSIPVRGNGPVKLQTCRRLSTGELLPTTQDMRRTLNDIREGDYIVGRKDKRSTRSRNMAVTTPRATPALSMSLSSSESSGSPRTPPETSDCAWSVSLDEHVENSVRQSVETHHDGLGILSGPVTSFQTRSGHWHSGNARQTLNWRSSYVSTATSPSVHTIDEQNATITALLKAKNNRLVDMYRREKMYTTGIACQPIGSSTSVKSQDQVSDPVFDSLPLPNFQKFDDSTKRSSNTSTALNQCCDDNSEASSTNRASLISSITDSSYTEQTNSTEYDAVATRDDIRKLVDQMRSTYIRAMDVNAPPVPQKSLQKKRRVKPAPGIRVKHSMTPSERQTWHSIHQRQSLLRNNVELATTSHLVSEFGRLSPVEVLPSQPQEKRPTDQLQRADSSTLGSIVAKLEKQPESQNRRDETDVSARRESMKRRAALFRPEYPRIDKDLADSVSQLSEMQSARDHQTHGNFF